MSLSIKGSPLYGSYQRVVNKPVDTTSVWATYTLAAEYAANNGTDDYCPYDGQIVVTLQGYPDVTDVNSDKYKTAHVWRLKKDGADTTVNGLTRQHFALEEVKAGTEVAGTNEHNTFTGTQTFESWIELLGGMTMGYKLAKDKDGAGNPIIKTDPITGKPLYIDGQGNEQVLADDMERIWLDSQGKGHMVISALKVLGTLEVSEIDVNHIKHSGGLFVNSRANIIVDSVEQLSGGRTKLTFVGQANGQTLFNLFEVGDLALSMTFNVLKEGASTPSEGKVVRWYWREVVAVDDTSITLAPQDASLPEMATPRKGDTVVQVGHVDAPEGADDDKKAHVASRQGLQVMGFSDTNGPFIAEYSGIKAPSASISFDEQEKAIVYLSPKYHKLQGDEILLKSGNQYIQLATQLTAIANDISLKADNQWLLKMSKNSAGMYVVGEHGEAINSGRMILVANTDGSIGAVTIANNGEMTYSGNFTLNAANIDFSAGAINLNTAKFVVGSSTLEGLLEIDAATNTAYIRTNLLNVNRLKAQIVNAEQIVANALTASATFNAHQATIQNLKVTGSSEFGGELKGATGTFSGNLSAAGGTFIGDLSAAGGTFSGDLQAAGGTFSGDLQAAGGTFTGNLSAVGGTFSGRLSSASGEFNGSVVIAGGKILIDGNEVNGVTDDGTQMHIGVNGLIAKAANTLNQYLLANTGGIEMRWGDDGIKLSSNGLQRYINGDWADMFAKPRTRAIESETTLKLQDQNIIVRGGSDFDITLPAGAPDGMQIMIKHTQNGSSVRIMPNTGQQILPTDDGNGKRLYNTDCCWLTMLDNVWYWNYAEV